MTEDRRELENLLEEKKEQDHADRRVLQQDSKDTPGVSPLNENWVTGMWKFGFRPVENLQLGAIPPALGVGF